MGLSPSDRTRSDVGRRLKITSLSLPDIFSPVFTNKDVRLILFSFMSLQEPAGTPRRRATFAGYCGPIYASQSETELGLFTNNSGHLVDDGTSLNGQPTLKAGVQMWTNTASKDRVITPFSRFQAVGTILVNSAGDLRLTFDPAKNQDVPGAANWAQLDFQMVETKPGIYVASNDVLTALVGFRRGDIRLNQGEGFPTR